MFSGTILEQCRYLVGMRVHSLVFACQMGIPFVSLSYQPKNHAFCGSVGMEDFSVDLYKLDRLPNVLQELVDGHSRIRDSLLDARVVCQREITLALELIRDYL